MPERYYSAEQVICVAAWGNSEVPFDPDEGKLHDFIVRRWGSETLTDIDMTAPERRHKYVLAMRQTLARCQWRKRHGRIHATRWPTLRPKLAKIRTDALRRILRPGDRVNRRWTRIIIRLSRRTTADILAELRADMSPLYKMIGQRTDLVSASISRVNRDLANGILRPLCRPITNDHDLAGDVGATVPSVVLNSNWKIVMNESTERLELKISSSAFGTATNEQRNVRFPADVVDRLYRPQPVGDREIAGSASSRIAPYRTPNVSGGSTLLEDLPADWTLNQATAWIMFRDPTLVAKVANIGGNGFQMQLEVVAAYGPACEITGRSSAQDEMLTRLRAGDLRSRGRIAGQEGSRPMEPLEWTQGEWDEKCHQPVLQTRHSQKYWFDITIAKTEVIRIWPKNHPILDGEILSQRGTRNINDMETGLPPEEWIHAPVAFAWWSGDDVFNLADFLDRVEKSPSIIPDAKLQDDIRRLGKARDEIVERIREGTIRAYLVERGTNDLKPLQSFIFIQGFTINIFDGTIDCDNMNRSAVEAYRILKENYVVTSEFRLLAV